MEYPDPYQGLGDHEFFQGINNSNNGTSNNNMSGSQAGLNRQATELYRYMHGGPSQLADASMGQDYNSINMIPQHQHQHMQLQNAHGVISHDVLPEHTQQMPSLVHGQSNQQPLLSGTMIQQTHVPQIPQRPQQQSKQRTKKKEGAQQRKKISPQQTAILEAGFQRHPKPDKTFREELSIRTGLPQRNIQIWFQNRRAKAKHDPNKNRDKKLPQLPVGAVSANLSTAGGGFDYGQYTLNPPPMHHTRPQPAPPQELFQYPNVSSQIVSQVIQIPAASDMQHSPQFRGVGGGGSTPMSASASAPTMHMPLSATSSCSSLSLANTTSNSTMSTSSGSTLFNPASDGMNRSFSSLDFGKQLFGGGSGAQGFLNSHSGLAINAPVAPDNRGSIISDGGDDGMLLTPHSSLQSPSMSPYMNNQMLGNNSNNSQVVMNKKRLSDPSTINDMRSKSRRPNSLNISESRLLPGNHLGYPMSAIESSFSSSMLQNSNAMIAPRQPHQHQQAAAQHQQYEQHHLNSTDSLTTSVTAAQHPIEGVNAAQVKRSQSLSGVPGRFRESTATYGYTQAPKRVSSLYASSKRSTDNTTVINMQQQHSQLEPVKEGKVASEEQQEQQEPSRPSTLPTGRSAALMASGAGDSSGSVSNSIAASRSSTSTSTPTSSLGMSSTLSKSHAEPIKREFDDGDDDDDTTMVTTAANQDAHDLSKIEFDGIDDQAEFEDNFNFAFMKNS